MGESNIEINILKLKITRKERKETSLTRVLDLARTKS